MALKQVVMDQWAEIARLKGLKGPSIKSSGMEQGNITSGNEDEEVIWAFSDSAGVFLSGFYRWRRLEQPGEAVVEIGTVVDERAVLQGLESTSKDGVAFVDGVLGIAQRMGAADLPLGAVPVPTGIAVGNPDLARGILVDVDRHARSPSISNHMKGRRG